MGVRSQGSGSRGRAGRDGVDGKDGANGKDGVNGINGRDGAAGLSKRVERYTATTNASGVATFTWPAFTATPDIDVIQTWSGEQMVAGGVTAQTLTGATVIGKVSRGTLALSSGPFQTAGAGISITVRVIGN